MINTIIAHAPVFLLVFVRCFAMIMTLPLFSMRTVPRTAKIALAGYMAYIIMPQADFTAYSKYIAADGAFSLDFLMIAAGEAMIGVIMGFYVTIIFSAFSTAGQLFAFQMGLSASDVYDAVSQVENPLMGQYLNLIAMLVFLQSHWFQKLFLKGLVSSFTSLNAVSLVGGRERIVHFLMEGLSRMFADALVIALPLMGTLILVNVCLGILGRAAPQMNLLSEGFPITMLISFFLLVMLMPYLCDFFTRSFNAGIESLFRIMAVVKGSGA